MNKVDHIQTYSGNIIAEKLEQLVDLFPEVEIEGRIDLQTLKAILGEIADDRLENYRLTWAVAVDTILKNKSIF